MSIICEAKWGTVLAPSTDLPPLKGGLFNYKSRILTYFTVNQAKVSFQVLLKW